ncbi:unnamed protein product [Meganyctiphanes norvegica]|uniref:Uncharacterized protein n=1 Tax=Meganyctiphanes norvegica TaxID=48144 RepID=A0AAV2Q167_MEGNR
MHKNYGSGTEKTMATRYMTCYFCTSEADYPGDTLYDPNCNNIDYNGHSEEHNSFDYSGCAVEVFDDGYVWRGWQLNSKDHCTTKYSENRHVNYTHCWCPGQVCNNGLCEECFDSVSTTTTPTTIAPTTSTTTVPTTTQQPHNKGLTCYNCVDCATVDENTSVAHEENFLTCVTIMTSHETVMRGGGYDVHDDGTCYVDGSMAYCHCTTDLCNDASV